MPRWSIRLLGLLAAASLARAQGGPAPPAVQVPVQTELVRVDVMVSDKSGRPQLGLTAADFEVLEDGVPQRVAQFRAYAPAAPSAVAQQPAPPPESPAGAAAPEAPPRRLVLLAVDDIHLEAANLLRLKKTLDRFVERDLPPEDLVGLVTTSGSLSHPMTTDREALRAAISRLSAQSRRGAPVARAHITDYQAEMIELGDPEALRVAVEEIQAERMTPDAEAEARARARQVLVEAAAEVRATLETLDQVVRGMAGLPGRKVLVLCSDGFLTGLSTGSRAAFDIRRITDAGTRAGVVVYGLDSRGLQANPASVSASSRRMVIPSIIGGRARLDQAGELAVHDAMHALAADTGGFLQAFTNDLGGALRKIVSDTDAYYLLAYEPSKTTNDGTFRKIEVRVPRLKGARVRHRKGYLATEARAVAAAPEAGAAAAAAPPRADALREALSSDAPAGGLRVGLSADYVSTDGTSSQLVVSGHVDLSGVPFTRAGDRYLATVDVAGSVLDESGRRVADLPAERASLDLDDDSHVLALRNGLQFQKSAPVAPGRYRVVLAARETEGGAIGKAAEGVEVPDLAGGRLALSSLFLTREEGGKRPASRKAQVDRLFRAQDSMVLEFFAYGGPPEGGAGLVSRTEIWQDGVQISVSRPEPIAARDASGRPRTHTRRFSVGAFPPGRYEVRVVVTDGRGNEVSSRAAFRIE
jgi:VWFA-related protein